MENNIDKNNLISIIDNFPGKRIAVIGDIALDGFIYGVIDRINPEMPSAPLLKVEKEEYLLGCAGNTALNLAKLNAKVKLFGVFGNDEYGKIIIDECKKNNIEVINVFQGKTLLKQRVKEKSHRGYIVRTDFGEFDIKELSDEIEDFILKSIFNSDYNAIVLSDYNKNIFKKNLAGKIIAKAKEKGIPVFVDPKPVNLLSFRKCTVLKHNEREAKEMVGKEYKDKNIEEIAKKIKEDSECEYVIITRGDKGMVCYDGGFHYIPTKAREVEDVTGAGDSVMAAIALAMASGANIVTAAHIGNYAGGIVVEKSGTAFTNIEELKMRIKEDKG